MSGNRDKSRAGGADMATTVIDGISTRYEIVGDGEPLLMFAPGGFDATIEKWTTLGAYAKTRMLDHLSKRFRCIVFDRRECGQSGGRVERVTWADYAAQGKGLLDHLGIKKAHLLGGCMGCSPVLKFAVTYPQATEKIVLFWPVGGAKYRIGSHQRFAEHLGFVQQNGLSAVVAVVREHGKAFGADPRGGPWASVLKHDQAFAGEFANIDVERYKTIVAGLARTLFDRDTAPGVEPEDLMQLQVDALIVPGQDASHATSAARYLQECIPGSQYWDVPVASQTEDTIAEQLRAFLG
jgi:pimeloyl-ACP methyl ester carboxylesterase